MHAKAASSHQSLASLSRPRCCVSAVQSNMSNNAIDDVTDSMAKATVSDHAAEKANGSINDAAGATSAAEGRRLYVGNLPYATTEGELKDFFSRFTM